MSDYELLSYIEQLATAIGTRGDGMMTGMFAYLVACYLVAEKLRRVFFIALSTMYLFFSLFALAGMRAGAQRLVAATSEAASRESLTIQMEMFNQNAGEYALYSTSYLLLFYFCSIVISIVAGSYMKAGKSGVRNA